MYLEKGCAVLIIYDINNIGLSVDVFVYIYLTILASPDVIKLRMLLHLPPLIFHQWSLTVIQHSQTLFGSVPPCLILSVLFCFAVILHSLSEGWKLWSPPLTGCRKSSSQWAQRSYSCLRLLWWDLRLAKKNNYKYTDSNSNYL